MCLGAHLLQASGFYHGETLPALSPGQAHPDPPVSSPSDLSFQAVGAGNSTARKEKNTNSTVAQGRHTFNADEISWGDESPPSQNHGALSDFTLIHPNNRHDTSFVSNSSWAYGMGVWDQRQVQLYVFSRSQ